MTQTRTETDSFGPLEVPADKYWGAQTQRSIINFPIGWERQPVPIIRALGVIKKACAQVNKAQGDLDATLARIADEACGAAHEADDAVSGSLQVAQDHELHEVAEVQRRRRRVESGLDT